MAIFHCIVSKVQRSRGQSSVAAAAYRAGEKLEYGASVFDYSRKRGVVCSELVEWSGTRQELWREAENAERINGTPAREVLIALPRELTDKERRALTRGFANWLHERYGCAVDFSIHAPGKSKRKTTASDGDETERTDTNNNHHAHILITTRRVEQGLKLGAKTRELDDRKTGPEEIIAIRHAWQAHANAALELACEDTRIDARSLKNRGETRQAKRHLGPCDTAKERRGESTAAGSYNRAIDELQALESDLQAMLAQVEEMTTQIEISQRIDTAQALTEKQDAQIAALEKRREGMRQTAQASENPAPETRSRQRVH